MTSTKKHIAHIVETYKKLNKAEYLTVCDGIRMQRDIHADKFASAKLQGSPDMRALFEIPMTLNEMLINNLDEGEMEWFKAGGTTRKEGARWFAKKFPEFRVPEIF